MMAWSKVAASVVVCFTMMAAASAVEAAEITVLCSNGMKEVLVELIPVFERATGNKVSVNYDTTTNIVDRLNGGAKTDLVVLTSEAIDALMKQGVVVPGSRVDLARSGIALAVRSGAPKPGIASPEALKQALLAAKSIAITSNGVSGVHMLSVMERLGIADAMKPRIIRVDAGPTGALVASGRAEIAVQQFSELMPVPGVEIIGALPGALQRITVFSAGLSRSAAEPAAAKALVQLLAADSAQPVITRKGLEPR